MATRIVARHLRRNFSTSGKVLSKEEQAAENVYIKKAEQEKLEKLARKGPKPEETKTAGSGGSASATEAKPSGESSSAKVSTDEFKNYAVIAGLVTVIGGLGWYIMSENKKSAEVHD